VAACGANAGADREERGSWVWVEHDSPEPTPSADAGVTTAAFAHAWTRHDLPTKSIQPGQAATVVEKLADYLIQSGY
jgi:hypothetical protein